MKMEQQSLWTNCMQTGTWAGWCFRMEIIFSDTDNCIRPQYPAHLWLQCSEHWIKNIQWLQCLVWLKGRTNASWLSGTILKHFLGSILHYLWMEQQCDVIADWRLGRTKRCNTHSCHLLWCSKSSNHNNSAHSWIRLWTKQLGITKVLVTGCF